jgi:hypothetical protein
MRALVSILVGSVASLVAFSILWSFFVVPHHSYGGDSRLSQIGGTFLYFSFTLFPFLLAALLVAMLTLELALIQKKKVREPRLWRSIVWISVSALALMALTISTDTFRLSAIISGLAATIFGAFFQQRIAVSIPKNEKG